MAADQTGPPFALPSSAMRMVPVGRIAILGGLVLLIAPIPLLLLATSRLKGSGYEEWVLGPGVQLTILLWVVAILLLAAGLGRRAVPRDPPWRRLLGLYRAGPAGPTDEALQVAAILPDNGEAGRGAALAELARRGLGPAAPVPLVPNFMPPHDPRATRSLVRTGAQAWRSGGGALIRFGVTAIAICAILFAIGLAAGAMMNVPLERNYAAGTPGGIAILIAFLAGCAAMIVIPLAWLRRRPLRLLFLRKFNSKPLSSSYRRLAQRHLKPFGHVLGLSDRYLRDSWLRWFFRSNFVLGRVDPLLLAAKLVLLLPPVLILRLFDTVRYGPPTIRTAAAYRRFCVHLTERKRMNLRCGWSAGGLFVRTSDDYWQLVAFTLLIGSDAIVLDLSEPTQGVEWEIAAISRFGLWHRTIVICRADRTAEAMRRGADGLFAHFWVYDQKGRFADAAGFEAALLAAAHASIRWRWALAVPGAGRQ